jgi:hypothetical protein
MTAPRPVCVHCGALYGRRATKTEELRWPANEPMPTYRGNGVVVKTSEPHRLQLKADILAEREQRRQGGGYWASAAREPELDPRFYTDEPTMHVYREVWDGESWFASYEPFCTLRCALDYARKAYRRAAR